MLTSCCLGFSTLGAATAGFHRIGFNPILSFIAIFVIHLTFSYWSLDGWIPDPRFPIYTKNIHRTRHGSDSHIYDSEGRFIPVRPLTCLSCPSHTAFSCRPTPVLSQEDPDWLPEHSVLNCKTSSSASLSWTGCWSSKLPTQSP